MMYKTIELVTLHGRHLTIKGITKGSNAIVDSKHGIFLISKRNFNKLIASDSNECVGVISKVEGFDLPMFKTLKF